MIRKFFFNYIKFQAITTPVTSRGNKIKQNQLIQNSKSKSELFSFYQIHGHSLNMINVVSYIRKYTDYMIANNQTDDEKELTHTFEALAKLKLMISTQNYKQFGDRETDHKRSFIMLLSLSVELIQRTKQSKYQTEYMNYAKLAISQLKEENRLNNCNIDELSVFLRCITQINELHPNEQEEVEYWILCKEHLHSITAHISSKLLHSLSKFNTFNENLIAELLKKLKGFDDNDINQKDAISLFFSFKHISEKTDQFTDIIQQLFIDLQLHMIKQNYKLNAKYIGMIYNVLATVSLEINIHFINYLQSQLFQTGQMTMLCLAHLFQYYQSEKTLQIQINEMLSKKILSFLQQVQIKNISESEQFIMFFNSIGNYCTSNYVEQFIPIFQKLPLNDFILGKIFSGLLKLPQSLDHFTELCQISVTLLQKYDAIINIHALNSIYRAQCILNARFGVIIQEVVDNQLNEFCQKIITDDYVKMIEAKQYYQSFELLQVLFDFLNIYTFTGTIGKQNRELISQQLKNLKRIIMEIKNDKLQAGVGKYLQQLNQFID